MSTTPPTAAKPTSSSTAPPAATATATATPFKEQLLQLVKTAQFGLFVGHFSTLFFTFLYFLTYTSSKTSYVHYYSYKLIYLSVIASFGNILYQSVKCKVLNISDYNALLLDDNFHYIFIAASLLLLLPPITLAIIPFALYSTFHTLSYILANILPIVPLNTDSIASRLSQLVKNYHNTVILYAANFEITTFLYILLRALLWSKGFWIGFVLYGLFIRLRFEKSIVTRSCFKNLEVKLDGLASTSSVPPIVKKYWIDFKSLLKTYSKKFSLTTQIDESAKAQ
ncbi:hypothetical protein CANARDRAFT_7624 [[Candida] arabinofermentans NRRL YB-2248]|uniref:Pore membrane protein of 33 kDa n=1 Tax=[Candida] arabinofermentans NRRL YB-2248 TaxID=983967 RepID=A0A1E4T184_9ASCO|nr:hypothetical protein CANARDRAFT_7624 [[Candida] arabinofermentans NRRL YB-2248]